MRIKNRPRSTVAAAESGPLLDPASYGLGGFPAFSSNGLPGEDVAARAAAYVDGLDLARSTTRGMLLFRAECLLDDFERDRDGRPSFEQEILDVSRRA